MFLSAMATPSQAPTVIGLVSWSQAVVTQVTSSDMVLALREGHGVKCAAHK